MAENAVPGFLPSVNGLHFNNSFPHEPLVQVPWFPMLHVGDAANGICGGMVFTVRDLLEAGLLPDAEYEPPAQGSPRRKYLVHRLARSFNLPFAPLRYWTLMLPGLPEGRGPLALLGLRGRARTMIERTWPKVRADIDAGHPSPLVLIRVLSQDPRQLGHNHQVLAYRYRLDGTSLEIGVYDPNHPNEDSIALRLDVANPNAPTPVTYTANDGDVFCFVRADYSPHRPGPWITATTRRLRPLTEPVPR